ncbi:uncharacterized protein LOC128240114 [Mya arenaria]|uniref:uncharacterized protein LOC128240114 n=1 Tax=Mya arenaria TaxID=6604 RepID=UPI0022E4C7E5|nr:uncharacterized protein LOC128240114 [Mya arenaria]
MRHLVMLIVVVMGMDVICVSGKSFQFSESVQNFGKTYLCKTDHDKQAFQRAIMAKACPSSDMMKNTGVENDSLMTLMVETLCKDTGGWLEKWVLKYVDYDNDQTISSYDIRWYFQKK